MSISANLQAAYGATQTSAPTSTTAATSASKVDASAGLLRKSMDAQQQAAQALLSQLNGKGQNLDIRV